MPKKRRLEDLYVRGKDVTFDDGNGEPVTVWVQKLNPVDHSTAIRKADAARARVLSVRSQPESEEYLALKADVLAITNREDLIAQITAEDQARVLIAREAELAAEDEWAKDNYLQGLRDSWTGGLGNAWAEDEEDPEAVRVLAELKRFNEAVAGDVEDELAALRKEYANTPLDALQDQAMEPFLKDEADAAWLREFYRCEVWLATRDGDNHREKVFGGRHEVDALEARTFSVLSAAIREITVDPLEGKDSEATPTSSLSSTPSGAEATEVSSGPAVAAL